MASSYYGQRADWVKKFQEWANSRGQKLDTDGIWGKNTEAAYAALRNQDADAMIKGFQTGKAAPAAKTTASVTADLDKYIQEHYPGMIPLLGIPEIKDGLLKAAKEHWSSEKLQAWFYGTKYWKTHTSQQEKWQTLSPAERGSERLRVAAQMLTQLQALYGTAAFAKRLGNANMRPEDFVNQHFDTVEAVASGKLPYEAWLVKAQTEARHYPGTQAQVDELQRQEDLAVRAKRPQEVAEQIWQQAHGDYFINISKTDALAWANSILGGKSSFGELQDFFRKQATDMYPFYKDSINNGVLPKALFGPALGTLSQELESSPEAIIANPKIWGEITSQAAGSKGPFTASDWVTYARNLPEWKGTHNARTMTADLQEKLLKNFGAIA